MKVKDIETTKEELRVMLETGFILREAANFEDAEAVFKGCVELLPDSEVPLVGLGTVYLQKGDFNLALESCKEALDCNPESSYAKVHYAEALLFQKRREEAEEVLIEVLEDSPDTTYAKTAENLLEVSNMLSSD